VKPKILIILVAMLGNLSCQAQNQKQTNMETTNNPLMCDPVEGVCGIPEQVNTDKVLAQHSEKPVKVLYFTDPICSSCWGIEPQLRKLKLEYPNTVDIEYHMGGLLPDWSYNSGGISKPSDVAHHWDEVSHYYDMPIDGDIWLEDPLHSSYPPSIAFKAAELQDKSKALVYLRELREMVFLHKINISKWENLEKAAQKVGLDVAQLKEDYNGKAKLLFEEDLKLARELGVRGFPTFIFSNKEGKKESVYGSKPYEAFESAVRKLDQSAEKKPYAKTWEDLFAVYKSLTEKEFSVLSGVSREESEKMLIALTTEQKLVRHTTKNGSIWNASKKE